MARRMPITNLGLLSGAGFSELPMGLPGLVRDALEEVGALTDLGEGLSRLTDEWVAQQTWSLALEIPLEGFEAQRAFLELWGLCGSGTLRVGEDILATFEDGNLTVEMTPYLAPELERLMVTLVFAPVGPDQLTPPPPVGITGGMRLRGVRYLSVDTMQVNSDLAAGHLQVSCAVDCYQGGPYAFSYVLMQGSEVLEQRSFEETLSPGATTLRHKLRSASLWLWRPGQKNPLYTLRLTVTRHGMGCDRLHQRVGFRTLGVERTPVEGRAVLRDVNGERTVLRGLVWQRFAPRQGAGLSLEQLFRALREAHVNCLRVAQAESEAFYDACDRYGIMVCQQLPFDPAEAAMCVKMLAYRACIVMWCLPRAVDAQGRPLPLDHPRVAPIAEMLATLSDGRPFLGVSPGGPVAQADFLDLGKGLCFDVLGPDRYEGPEWLTRYFNLDDAVLRTLSPTALAPMDCLSALAGDRRPWPPEETVWSYYGGEAPRLSPEQSLEWFGRDITGDLSQMIRLSRYFQAQTLRYAAQRARSRGAGGIFARQFYERYAMLGSPTLLEASGRRRPAFFALAAAFAPACLCARLDRLAFWVDTHVDLFVEWITDPSHENDEQKVDLSADCYASTGERFFSQHWQVPNRTAQLPMTRFKLPQTPGMVLLRLEARVGLTPLFREDISLSVGLYTPQSPLIDPAQTELTLGAGELRNTGDAVAFGVCCDGYLESWMPGWGALLPGEGHPVRLKTQVEAFNAGLLLPVSPKEGTS